MEGSFGARVKQLKRDLAQVWSTYREASAELKKQTEREADLDNLRIRRKDENDYGLVGEPDVYTRMWVIEGKRGKIAYGYRQETAPDGSVDIRETLTAFSPTPMEEGQKPGIEGKINEDLSNEPLHPALRGDNSILAYQELASIYDSKLPAL